MNVDVQHDSQNIKIYINGLLHLHLERKSLMAIHSWFTGDRHMSIEFHFDSGATVLTEYDDHGKWSTILTELDRLVKINRPEGA